MKLRASCCVAGPSRSKYCDGVGNTRDLLRTIQRKIKGAGNRAGKSVGPLRKMRGEEGVGRKSFRPFSSEKSQPANWRGGARISPHRSLETESMFVVTRGWRAGQMGSDCFITSFWGDKNVKPEREDTVAKECSCTQCRGDTHFTVLKAVNFVVCEF